MSTALSGCATEYELRYPLSEGWYPATAVRLNGEFAPPYRPADDCRLDRALAAGQGIRFAEVEYRWHRILRHRIVALPDEGAVRVGDKLYVNLRDCGTRSALVPSRR